VLTSNFLPDEIDAAVRTIRSSMRDAAPTRRMRARYAAFYLFVFAIGSWIGTAVSYFGALSSTSSDFWRSALTALSILIGFMITTMLFTGKVESKSLTLEQLKGFCDKSTHLLISQFATLLTHIGGVVAIATMTAIDSKHAYIADCAMPIIFGFLVTSLLRSVLVPIQIIELHRFTQEALLADKRAEIKNNLPS